MRNLLKLLYAYHFHILFVLLEGIALLLVVQNNHFQRASAIQFSSAVSGSFHKKMDNLKVYLSLRETNQVLAQENAELRNRLASIRKNISEKKDTLIDTLYKQRYTYFSAKIVNNSVSKQYNYITLNKGSNDGIKSNMAVITSKGIVGFIVGVSKNFSTVLSVLNRNFKVSAKFKKNNFLGSLSWESLNPEICLLSDIPFHVKVAVGDTIVTTGFSDYFPEGIPIGTVKDYDLKNGNFYNIRVKLTNDFRNLNYVILVDNLMKAEQQELESQTEHD
jgi:rod shape-determining protein MreC